MEKENVQKLTDLISLGLFMKLGASFGELLTYTEFLEIVTDSVLAVERIQPFTFTEAAITKENTQ